MPSESLQENASRVYGSHFLILPRSTFAAESKSLLSGTPDISVHREWEPVLPDPLPYSGGVTARQRKNKDISPRSDNSGKTVLRTYDPMAYCSDCLPEASPQRSVRSMPLPAPNRHCLPEPAVTFQLSAARMNPMSPLAAQPAAQRETHRHHSPAFPERKPAEAQQALQVPQVPNSPAIPDQAVPVKIPAEASPEFQALPA